MLPRHQTPARAVWWLQLDAEAFGEELDCCLVNAFARIPFFTPFGTPQLLSRNLTVLGVLRAPPLNPAPPPLPGVSEDDPITAEAWFWVAIIGGPFLTACLVVAGLTWARHKREKDHRYNELIITSPNVRSFHLPCVSLNR